MTITPAAAISDPELLGTAFAGTSWATWRAVLKAAYAEPLNTDEQALFHAVAGDRDPPARRVRELVVIAGRRSGKDSIASAVATTAAIDDYSAFLRPGERASVLCLAVDREQAKIVNRYIGGYFREVPLLKPLVARETDDGVELKNGVEIVVGTNSFRSVRGRTIACAIFDEASFWRSEDSASPDVETYTAVVPGMITLPGAILIIITTAYRRAGLAYQKWVAHFGKNDDDVLVVYGPSPAFNPSLPQLVIDAALARDPEAAGAEWLSEWRSDLSDFLDRELVAAAVDGGVVVRVPQPGIAYTAFADPSGGRGDSFACAIAHAEGDVAILDMVREWRAPFVSSVVVREAADLLRQYRITSVTGDRWAADWPAQAFAEVGIRYLKSDRDKSALYLDFLPLATAGRVRLVDNPRLAYQLISLERRSGRGKDRVDHPAGQHDDLANVAAGVLVEAASEAAPGLIRQSDFIANVVEVEGRKIATIFSVLIVASDGRCGLAYFGAVYPHLRDLPLIVLDFEQPRMSADLFHNIAVRLDELAEYYHREAKRGQAPHVLSLVPEVYHRRALDAMCGVFGKYARHAEPRQVLCNPLEDVIDPAMLADPVRLHFAASAHFIDGRVKFAAAARERMATLPVSLTAAFGDHHDPVTLALWAGPVLQFEPQPSRRAA